jgi:membrane associated rhomboid family serine protease
MSERAAPYAKQAGGRKTGLPEDPSPGDKPGVTSLPPVSSPPDSPPPYPPEETAAQPRPPRERAINIPLATGMLIAINVLVHAVLSMLPGDQGDWIVNGFGFDPADLLHPNLLTVVSLITYQFLHGSWTHLGANMVSLLAFGAGVERPLGRRRFLTIYFAAGVLGALVQAAFTYRNGDDLLIGASASVSGIFGALIVIWGINKRGRNPMGMLPMAVLWIVLMTITGISGFGAGGAQVAWIAHIGGFVVGMTLGGLFKPKAATG